MPVTSRPYLGFTTAKQTKYPAESHIIDLQATKDIVI